MLFARNKPGKEKASRKYLYWLFPYGCGQQACKIAGMRKPLKLMLDIQPKAGCLSIGDGRNRHWNGCCLAAQVI